MRSVRAFRSTSARRMAASSSCITSGASADVRCEPRDAAYHAPSRTDVFPDPFGPINAVMRASKRIANDFHDRNVASSIAASRMWLDANRHHQVEETGGVFRRAQDGRLETVACRQRDFGSLYCVDAVEKIRRVERNGEGLAFELPIDLF